MSKTTVALAGIVILSVGILAAWSVPQGEDPAVLLRAAIEKEEVDGNLDAASSSTSIHQDRGREPRGRRAGAAAAGRLLREARAGGGAPGLRAADPRLRRAGERWRPRGSGWWCSNRVRR